VNGYRRFGNFDRSSALESGIELSGTEGTLRIESVHAGIIRVEYQRVGRPARGPSYAIDPAFRPDANAPNTEVRDGSHRLTYEDVSIEVSADGLLSATYPDGSTFARDSFGVLLHGDRFGFWKEMDDAASYVGMGERTRRLLRNDSACENWNTDNPAYKIDSDPLYKSIPFYICIPTDGRPAHGIFVDNSHRSVFDFGARAVGHVSAEFDGGDLVYYILTGPAPRDVLRRYTLLTGRTSQPPRWALGYHQSRWSYYPESTVCDLAREFRERNIPLDVIHLDIHYMDGYRVFTWDNERFPDPAGMNEALRDIGIRTVAIVDPGVKKDAEYDVAREGLESGHFVTLPDGSPYEGRVWPGECHFPDFTRPGSRTWFGDRAARMLDDGVSGIWTDMNEPSVFGGKTMPDAISFDMEGMGGTHAEAHNVYGLQMARSVHEGLQRRAPDARPFVITRAGFAGMQRYGACWTGDNVSSWEHLRLAIPMMLSLGISGVPFVGTDIGGFDGEPEPELFARWMQLGAFSPFFRAHSAQDTSSQEPWSFGEEVEAVCREAIRLRYRLIPYLESAFHSHRLTGAPILRPLIWEYPADPHCQQNEDQFLFGETLLVAPVVERGATSREVYLPEGAWFDFATGAAYVGGQTYTIDAPLSHIPLFARAGSVLPLCDDALSTDSQDRSRIELIVFRGSGSTQWYEDDGASNGWMKGDVRETTFRVSRCTGGTRLEREIRGSYDSPVRMITVRLPSPGARSVEVPADFHQVEFPD
jgi:alpha-glucosidase